MAKKKRLFAATLVLVALVLARPAYFLAAWFSILPIKYYTVGKPSYSRARGVADPFMAKAADGPWEYSNGNFILDFDGSSAGKPTWVFRYVNPRTGQKSIRIYVPIPEYRVHDTDRALGLRSAPKTWALAKIRCRMIAAGGCWLRESMNPDVGDFQSF